MGGGFGLAGLGSDSVIPSSAWAGFGVAGFGIAGLGFGSAVVFDSDSLEGCFVGFFVGLCFIVAVNENGISGQRADTEKTMAFDCTYFSVSTNGFRGSNGIEKALLSLSPNSPP